MTKNIKFSTPSHKKLPHRSIYLVNLFDNLKLETVSKIARRNGCVDLTFYGIALVWRKMPRKYGPFLRNQKFAAREC